jgi:hypothetical protein
MALKKESVALTRQLNRLQLMFCYLASECLSETLKNVSRISDSTVNVNHVERVTFVDQMILSDAKR